MDTVRIFDTTLRDGEQAPGYSMNADEKARLARQLEALGVDAIEAGFPIASQGDFDGVRAVAAAVRAPVVASLCRALRRDIDVARDAVRDAARPRLHTFLATSDIHLASKLSMTRDQALERAVEAVKYSRNLCDDVEFSLEDATRTDRDFLCRVVEAVIAAGAATVNLPDTVGYATPAEMREMVRDVLRRVPNAGRATLSMHCHDDLGLAVANTLAGVEAGARQAECCLCGIGERAGNAALEEVVMNLRTRRDAYGLQCGVRTEELVRSAQLLASITGVKTPPSKAVVGANAFAHESGIHQHGILANAQTYQIMTPESVGVKEPAFVLGKHSGRHAFAQHLAALGYEADDATQNRLFEAFKALADRKRAIDDRDIIALVEAEQGHEPRSGDWTLSSYAITSGGETGAAARITLARDGQTAAEEAAGAGPVIALVRAIEKIVAHPFTLLDYRLQAVTERRDALGEAIVKITDGDGIYRGRGLSIDILEATILATLDATNKMLSGTRRLGTGAASLAQQTYGDIVSRSAAVL